MRTPMFAHRLLLIPALLLSMPASGQVVPAALKAAAVSAPSVRTESREAQLATVQLSVIDFGRRIALLKVPVSLLDGAGARDARRPEAVRDLLVNDSEVIDLGGLLLKVELLPPDTLKLHPIDDRGNTYTFALVARGAERDLAEANAGDRPALIRRGEPIHLALETLAKADGWTLVWYPTTSWKAIADVDLRQYKDAASAIADVVSILRDEGKPIALRISEGNKVLEVLSTEVKND